ncbi:DUF2007 domain-containing protein [Gynuella sunshinyii]|uniref:RanBP2-type domain-containing protein n=1 Tax=Gynuella sunshinyii YC6258 TaxID=1445510 RepID=A0A0C5VDK4_9GAMM|nr:DUF2007 domain-containing protein [Gynuella sunshinyii]AJQ92617.1 hypothetical Protein YC6258_00567 [Gynuella sunshinyii YC6258]
MKKVFSSRDLFLVQRARELLEAARIPCNIHNEYSAGAVGELSFLDTCPELWISDDEWYPRARKILAELEPPMVKPSEWVCHSCHEHNAGSFDMCWQCGADRELQNSMGLHNGN